MQDSEFIERIAYLEEDVRSRQDDAALYIEKAILCMEEVVMCIREIEMCKQLEEAHYNQYLYCVWEERIY